MRDQTIVGITFGKWLRQQRRTLDLTQEVFADQAGCARITLRRIESDALKPSKELALILLEKTGIPKSEREAWLPFTRGLADLPVRQTNPLLLQNNLPAFLTSFIGREKERADVIHLIAKNRLVTLTGSGGVGKTRLSIHVASELVTEYPIGVWLVELAPLTDPALVPQSVCAVLGVKPEGKITSLEALIQYLRSKKILLVLDNCEHLIDACAQLCTSLLRSCPELRILTSSREALSILGEQAYRVPSLSLPDSKSILNIIQESEAVTLFMEHAKASQHDFELTEFNAPFVAQICQRLDGIALAIELAASRVKMFKVEQIADRLNNVFELLTSGNRTALPRQQTLRALIDWSYNLLSEKEKTFLRRLSVFMGGWTLEAAESVCGDTDALNLLTRLVDKSLVSVGFDHGDRVRYYLLETIRQFANEKLIENEDVSHLRNVHLEYFLNFAERIAPELHTRKGPLWLDHLETEYANFQLALEWAEKRGVEIGLRLCNSLHQLWFIHREYTKEGLGWFEKFLNTGRTRRNIPRTLALLNYYNLSTAAPGSDREKEKIYLDESLILARKLGDHSCLTMVLGSHGSYELFSGNYESAQIFYEESLSEARLAEDDRLIGIAFYRLAQLAWYRTDNDTASSLFKESLIYLRKTGDLRWLALCSNFIGVISAKKGDWQSAHTHYEEALSLAREAHDRLNTSLYLSNLGLSRLGVEDFEQASFHLDQAIKLVKNTPDDDFLYLILKGLGDIAHFQGNIEASFTFYTEGLACAQWESDRANVYCLVANAERLCGQMTEAKQYLLAGLQLMKTKAEWGFSAEYVIPYIAYFALDCHLFKQAISFLGWIEGQNKAKKLIRYPVYQAEFNRYLARAREQILESEFDVAWAEGHTMSQEKVLAMALDVLQ